MLNISAEVLAEQVPPWKCTLLVNEVNIDPKSRADMPTTSYSKPVIGATGKTGSWRTFTPKIDYDECSRCRTCWLHCPEAVISLDEDGTPHIDLDYCKGCGCCAEVCPKKCISMIREGFDEEESA